MQQLRVLMWGLTGLFFVAATAAGGWYAWQEANRGPTVLTVAAGPRGGAPFALLDDVAAVLERQGEPVRLQLLESATLDEAAQMVGLGGQHRAAPLTGPTENADGRIVRPQRVDRGADLGVVATDAAASADLRLIARLNRDVFHLIARADRAIASVHDLDGKRVALPPVGTGGFKAFWTVATHYGVGVERIGWQVMEGRAAVDALAAGRIDAIFVLGAIRAPNLMAQLDELGRRAVPLTLVPIEQAPAMGRRRPFIEATTLERGTYAGAPALPPEPLTTASIRLDLIGHATADADAVAALTRVLMERRFDLLVRTPLAQDISAPDLSAGALVPLHPGADRYYRRDQPGFIEANANSIGIALTVLGILGSGMAALRARWQTAQKGRADRYNADLLGIIGEVRAAASLDALIAGRDRLDGILSQVIADLDSGAVSEEGFESFSLAFQAVRARLADAIAEARRADRASGAPAN
jgi:TRAP transporter TAXI family solute receptor